MKKIVMQYFSGFLLGAGSLLIGFTIAGVYTSRSLVKPDIGEIGAVPKAFIVESGSMEPTIRTGSLVFTLPSSRYSPGDIVTFQTNDDPTTITHRINFKMYPDGIYAPPVYITSGDANDAMDSTRIKNENIIGKVFFTVPYLGRLSDAVKHPLGFAFIIITPVTVVIYEVLKFIISRSGKKDTVYKL